MRMNEEWREYTQYESLFSSARQKQTFLERISGVCACFIYFRGKAHISYG